VNAQNIGKRTKALINIGDLLGRYCEAALQERAAIAKKIEKESARLPTEASKPKTKK
jgi:hypothetical protein